MFCGPADMETTYAEYEEWSENGVPETAVHLYRKALQQKEKCKSYEEALVTDWSCFWFAVFSFFQSFAQVLQPVHNIPPVLVFLQLVAEPPKLAEYQAYIEFELKEGDPARVQITFERALAENCLVPDMWTKYTTYLVSIG